MHIFKMNRKKANRVMHNVLALITASLAYLCPLSRSQVVQGGMLPLNSTSSSADAVRLVDRSVAAMGGDAWKEVGGAVAEATYTSKELDTKVVMWSDDWSNGRVRFRREAKTSDSNGSFFVGSDAGQYNLHRSGGKPRQLQHDVGIAVIVVGYPAAALILSKSKYHCTFSLGSLSTTEAVGAIRDNDVQRVLERCPDPFYPEGTAVIGWGFSKSSGLPEWVSLPIWGETHHRILSETVTYTNFKVVDKKTIPAALKIQRPSGHIDQVAIDNTSFNAGLPDSLFKVQ